MDVPKLPLADWVNALIGWMQGNLDWLFGPIKDGVTALDAALRDALVTVPSYLVIAAVVGFLLWRKSYGAALAAALALGVIADIGLWQQAADNVSLVAIAAGLAAVFGAPAGVLISEMRAARRLLVPLLDFMQATPAFVYLIPSVLFFGIGAVPGVLATAAFALPPVARAIALGLDEVPSELVE